MELMGWVWFTSRSTIGIVVCRNEVEEKAYIMGVEGNDEKSDLESIMNWGAKFPLEEAKSLITRLGTWKIDPNENPSNDSMIDRLSRMMDDPSFIEDFADYVAIKRDIEERHENRLLRMFNNQSDEGLHEFILKILKWEEKFEEMKYTKHRVQTESLLFGTLTKLLMKMGSPLEINDETAEDFLASGFTWEDFEFRIYLGQGCFVRVFYKGELVFQST